MPTESRRIVSLAPKTPRVEPFDEEDFQESDHVVSYSSKNKVEKTTFQAVSSPNSRHAAKLAQIALAVQTKQAPRPHERRAAIMSSSSAPRQQIQATTYNSGTYESMSPPQMDPQVRNGANTFQGNYPATAGNYSAPQQQQYQDTFAHSFPTAHYQTPIPSSTQEYGDVPQPVQPDNPVASGTPYAPQQLQQYQDTSRYWPQATQYAAPVPTSTQVTRQAPAPFQQPEVTRFATEERTAYQLRGQNGSLRVSAPVGSNEAQLFDEVARQNSEQRREPSKDTRIVSRKTRDSGNKGRGWFWT